MKLETEYPDVRHTLNEGTHWSASIDVHDFLADSSIVNATNITCLLYGCAEIDDELRNFPTASVQCSVAERKGKPNS